MEKRIDITQDQYNEIWDIPKGKKRSKRKNKELGDYFIMTTCNNQMILFDTIKEAREFNNSIYSCFKTEFFPQD